MKKKKLIKYLQHKIDECLDQSHIGDNDLEFKKAQIIKGETFLEIIDYLKTK